MWRYVILLLRHVIEDVSHYEQTKMCSNLH